MATTKKVVIVAVCGFVLSFLIGLFSSVSFGVVLLRAIFYALIFAGLYYALTVIFQRFLANNSGTTEHVSGGDSVIPQRGQLIDIKLDDEVLPDEDNAPLFKIPKELIPDNNTDNNVEVLESVDDAKEINDVKPGEKLFSTQQVPKEKEINTTGDSELGSLPDMESMLSDMQSSPSSEVITTSDFANSDNLVASGELRGADKEIMAKAIHTILARDNN